MLQVTSVTWRGIAVPPDENADLEASVGYVLEPGDDVPPGRPQALDLFGHRYGPGRQSLVISYSAGYAVQNEAQTVPAAAPLQLTAFSPYGPWGSDLGVTYTATGAPLTSVSASPAPGNMRSAPGLMRSPRRTPGNRFPSLTAMCRRISRRRPWNWRLSAFARPSASGSSRSRSAVRKQSPTTRAQCRRRSRRCCNPISGSSSDVRARSSRVSRKPARGSTPIPPHCRRRSAPRRPNSQRRSPIWSRATSFPAPC